MHMNIIIKAGLNVVIVKESDIQRIDNTGRIGP